MVDQNVGTSTKRKVVDAQWVQPPDSILIFKAHFHCVNVLRMYTPGFIDWFTMYRPDVFRLFDVASSGQT